MSVNTVEVPVQSVEAPQNIYENSGAGYSEKNQKNVMVADIAASALSTGGDMAATVEAASTESVETLKHKSKEDYKTQRTGTLASAVEHVAMNNPEQLPQAVQVAQAEIQAMPQRMEKEYAPFLNWVDSLDGSHALSETQKEDIAINMALLQTISKGLDERAWYETGWDILGAMAVPDESDNAAVLEANLMGDRRGLKEWLGSGDSFRRIGEFRRTLEADERYRFDKFLAEEIIKVDDNKLQQLAMVMGILGQDPSIEMFQALEKVELGLTAGAALGSRILSGLRALNVMRRLGEAGDARSAVVVANAVAADKAVGKAAGIQLADAATVGNPLNPSNIFNGAPKGVQKKYRDMQVDVDEALERSTSTLAYSIQPDPDVKLRMAESIEKNLSKRDDIDNIEIKEGVEGLNIKYDVLDEDGATTVRESVRYTQNDLGGFIQKDSGFVASSLRGITSPNTLLGKDRVLYVQAPEANTLAKARIGKSLADAVDLSLKNLNGKGKQNVSEMLEALDGEPVNPTYNQLVVEGFGGRRLSDDEFVAFSSVRKVLDDAWIHNNETVKREMELRGAKQVSVGDEVTYGLPNLDADSAYRMYSGDTDNVYVLDNGTARKGVGLEEIKQEYRNGKVLVKADGDDVKGWFSSDQGKVRYAFIPKADVTGLPMNVLGKVDNYLPKLREDANFFIKYDKDIVVDGKARKSETTLAYATTKAQAEAYIRKLAKTAQDAGEVFDASKYHIKFDREIAKGAANSDNIAASGGLIRGKRKSTPLEYAGDVTDAKRTDALDALQRYMAITADRMAMSEWRIEARTRFTNELATEAAIGEKARTTDWRSMRSMIENDVQDLQRRAKLLATYDQVSHMMNIPSKFDQALQGWTQKVGEKLEKVYGGQKIAKHLYRIHDQSPTDVMKGATFNLTLGMYNLVQIPVQLFGATVAMSINPIAAIKGLPKWLMSSALDFTTNERTARKFIDKMSKATGIDASEALKDYQFWKRTGMYESVIRGNADASSIANHLPYDAGVVKRTIDKIVSTGQAPYRMGELSNMRISFFTALEREKALKGSKFKYDDVTLQNVIARTEQYRLNMSGANKAAFQKGIWALPTQFKQIYTKYIEALRGTHFNKRDKAGLILGQMALFGFAGVPIVNHFTDEVLDTLGFSEMDLNSQELTFVKRGAMGWVINDVYDIDALVSGRLTVSADIIEDVSRSLMDEHTPMIKTFMGASFTTGDKVADLFTNMFFAGNMVLDTYWDDKEVSPVMSEAVKIVGRSIAELPSSSRKWVAAVELANGIVTNSKGERIDEVDPNLRDVLARAVGFGSQDMDDLYSLMKVQRKQKEFVNAYSIQMINILSELSTKIINQDEGGTEASQVAASIVQDSIARLDPVTAGMVWDTVYKRLQNPKTLKEQILHKAVIENTGELMSSANNLSIIRKKYLEERGIDE